MSTTNEKTLAQLLPKIQGLFDLMVADYNRFMPEQTEVQIEMRQEYKDGLQYSIGKNYIKILSNEAAHGFIVISHTDKKFKFGDLLKAASWAQPAKNFARGNIFQLEKCGKYIRWTGI